MKGLRVIQFYFRIIFRRRKTGISSSFETDKKPNKLVHAFNILAGFFYGNFQKKRESFRILRRNQEQRKTEYSIPFQIIKHSKSLLLLLLFVFAISIFFDWSIEKMSFFLSNVQIRWINNFTKLIVDFFSIPDKNFLKSFLEVSIGAISALLGLIFALYGVGFQIITEKYSSKVADYVNQEKVGNFFFKLLVFTDLFAILVLLRVQLFEFNSLFSFVVVTVLVATCLLGIVIFKNHYIVTIKSKSLFERLLSDIKENIQLVAGKERYSYSSWSIIKNSRIRTQDLLMLLKTLFEDLWQATNWNDVVYTPTVLAHILTDYANKKKFIDKERSWWFPQIQEEVKANDMTSLALKLNFELQGRGPLMVGKPDYLWFENRIFEILQMVESHIGADNEQTHLLSYVIDFYQTVLTGDYSRDQYGRYQKTIIGLYENQEIDAFEKYFNGYLALYSKIKIDDDLVAYMNGYFAVGLILIDGFDYSQYQKIIKSLIGTNGRFKCERKNIAAFNIPNIFYNQLLDYWDRLDLEMQCDGRIITPQVCFEKETLEDARIKEKQYFDKFFSKLCEYQDTIIDDLFKKGKQNELAQLLKLRFEWFSRMLYVKKSNLAEQYSAVITRRAVHLLGTPKKILLDSEFWEEIEKLIFPSIIENCRGLFKELTRSLALLLPAINSNEKDIDNIMYRNRLSIIVGGFIYLVSELRQDKTFLTDYINIIEKSYPEGRFIQALEILVKPKDVGGLDLTLKLINWESTRYHHWFGNILEEISLLPKTYGNIRHYYGMQEIADHPSYLVRELSYRAFNPEEKSSQAFVEWAKRRELIKKLVKVLSRV